jgi:hypothetical protein
VGVKFRSDASSLNCPSISSAQGYAAKCYDHQAALHTAFNHVFAASPGSTLVPALQAVCKSTHRAALAADREEKSLENKRLQNAVTLLQESFSRTFNDRKELRPGFAYDEEGSKKAGVLAIVNELFAIYFRLNTLRLCKNLVRPVETRKLHEQGTMGQMVTYRYFTGRLALFEDQFALAEENLEFAFQNCHKDANKNMELILHYLIPVKLYRGRYPSPDRKFLCSREYRAGEQPGRALHSLILSFSVEEVQPSRVRLVGQWRAEGRLAHV